MNSGESGDHSLSTEEKSFESDNICRRYDNSYKLTFRCKSISVLLSSCDREKKSSVFAGKREPARGAYDRRRKARASVRLTGKGLGRRPAPRRDPLSCYTCN